MIGEKNVTFSERRNILRNLKRLLKSIKVIKLTQKGAADVLRDLVAALGLGEVAELLVEHALELQKRKKKGEG